MVLTRSRMVRDQGYRYQQDCVIRQIPLGESDNGDQEAVDKGPLSSTASTGPEVLEASAADEFVFHRSSTQIHKCNLDSSIMQQHYMCY